jgi:uncharacterized protein YcfL
MRKLLLLALVLLFVSSLFVVGCGSKEEAESTSEKAEDMAEEAKDVVEEKAEEMPETVDSLMEEAKEDAGH